jgi:hypothetical protein
MRCVEVGCVRQCDLRGSWQYGRRTTLVAQKQRRWTRRLGSTEMIWLWRPRTLGLGCCELLVRRQKWTSKSWRLRRTCNVKLNIPLDCAMSGTS